MTGTRTGSRVARDATRVPDPLPAKPVEERAGRQAGSAIVGAMRRSLLGLLLPLLVVPACAPAGSTESATDGGAPAPPPEPERWRIEVVDRRPHDTEAYTQGLLWRDGIVYESTGSYGASSLRAWRWSDGAELARAELAPELFGEGIAIVPGAEDAEERLIQLTWRRGVALVWSLAPFAERGRLRYGGEGWGLAWTGADLVMSDGTPVLTFRDPETLEIRRRLRVTRSGMPVDDLNELELVGGLLFANLFGSDEIAAIDPDSGAVAAIVDASGLLTAEEAEEADVLNGIAWRPDTETFLLTGKYWPWVFEVRILGYDPRPPSPHETRRGKQE